MSKKDTTPKKRKKRPGEGRPTKYSADYEEQVYKLCLLGATNRQIASFFNVSESTVDNWKIEHPEFLGSIKQGKDIADMNVAHSMYKAATGYSHKEDKIFQYEGEPVIVPTTRYYPPDIKAAVMWLKNRKSDFWKDKVDADVTSGGERLTGPIVYIPDNGR